MLIHFPHCFDKSISIKSRLRLASFSHASLICCNSLASYWRGVLRKFVVEFTGGRLANLPSGAEPQPILRVSSGTCSNVFAEAVPDGLPGHWRASFDCTAAHPGVIEMRLFLKGGDQTLSETWLYQYTAD